VSARAAATPTSIVERIDALDWPSIGRELDAEGAALIPRLLTAEECDEAIRLYGQADAFRKQVDMARHAFGQGEYKYFAYPLPALVEGLRHGLYRHLGPVANRWNAMLNAPARFPPDLASFLERCRLAGQSRPTPLVLKYGPGDYNRLHQDLYGEHVFPIQVAILLSQPGLDFTGGEFVTAEKRPRMQSRVEVAPLTRGDALAFAVNHRPAMGPRGTHRVQMRHGVSRVRSGSRLTLGVIFHDAA
jgi:hypothetical protein